MLVQVWRMVLQILTTLVAGWSQLAQQAALEKAKAFHLVASKGCFEGPAGSASPLDLDEMDQEGTTYVFQFKQARIRVDRHSGAILAFFDSFSGLESDTWRPNALTQGQAIEHAQKLWLASGHVNPFKLYEPEQWSSGTLMHWKFDILRTYQGLPFHYSHGGVIAIEHVSGRLTMMSLFPSPPQPPTTLVPAVSLTTARARLMGALFSFRPGIETAYERHPVRLMIWRPDPKQLTLDRTTPEQRALGQENKGLLVYSAYVHDATRYGRNGEAIGAYSVFLDATTGELIGIEALEGGIGGASALPKTSIDLDFGQGESTELLTGQKVIPIKDGGMHAITTRQMPANVTTLLMRHGRFVQKVKFDRKTGMVWTGADSNLQSWKASPQVLRVLREAAKS